jgi:hypothetical protein
VRNAHQDRRRASSRAGGDAFPLPCGAATVVYWPLPTTGHRAQVRTGGGGVASLPYITLVAVA